MIKLFFSFVNTLVKNSAECFAYADISPQLSNIFTQIKNKLDSFAILKMLKF